MKLVKNNQNHDGKPSFSGAYKIALYLHTNLDHSLCLSFFVYAPSLAIVLPQCV